MRRKKKARSPKYQRYTSLFLAMALLIGIFTITYGDFIDLDPCAFHCGGAIEMNGDAPDLCEYGCEEIDMCECDEDDCMCDDCDNYDNDCKCQE